MELPGTDAERGDCSHASDDNPSVHSIPARWLITATASEMVTPSAKSCDLPEFPVPS
jgi:hypothetical protein